MDWVGGGVDGWWWVGKWGVGGNCIGAALQGLLAQPTASCPDPPALHTQPPPRVRGLPGAQGSVVQSGLILASALIFWAFRSGESESYNYISY